MQQGVSTLRPTNGDCRCILKTSRSIEMKRLLTPALRTLFNEAVASYLTETALLKFAKELWWVDYKQTREAADIVQMMPFSTRRRRRDPPEAR